MSPTRRRTLILVLGFALCAGCAPKPTVITYEPPVNMADLAAELSAPADGYQMTASATSTGRFPCSLAVARLALREDPLVVPTANDDSPEGDATPPPIVTGVTMGLELRSMRPVDEACWTERLRGLPSLRDVLFLSPRATKLEGQGPTALCASAHRLGAALLVVYAASGLGPNSSQSVGVLYDTATATPLATIYASARIVDAEGVESSPNALKGDRRRDDARYQAQRQFERYVEAAVRELIRRDKPAPSTQPNRWQTPYSERWWLPPYYPRW